MTLNSKTLSPAQEQEIARKLALASRLDHPIFASKAPSQPFFAKWFRQRYAAEPTPDLVTPLVRAEYMKALESALLATAERVNWLAERDAEEAEEAEEAAEEAEEAEEAEPQGPDPDGTASIAPLVIEADPTMAFGDPFGPPPYPGEDDQHVILLGQWCQRFGELPYDAQHEWNRTHIGTPAWAGSLYQEPALEPNGETPNRQIAERADWRRFESYTASVIAALARIDGEFDGTGLGDDDDDGAPAYLIDGKIPAGPATTVVYGLPDAGKSMLAHKLAVTVGSESLDLDGAATVHGRVLYVTLDSGARRKQVKFRMVKICQRLGITAASVRVILVDDAVNLLDPASIDKLLARHPGPWALIVLDPLVKCVGGLDLAQAGVMTPALSGANRLGLETGAAVVVVTHEGHGDKGRPFGSIFMAANADAILHVVRRANRVAVSWDRLRNDSVPEPITYRIEEAYLLAPGEAVGKRRADPATAEAPDMLAALPTTPIAVRGSRALIEHLFPEELGEKGRESRYARLRKSWESAGFISQSKDKIWRIEP